MLSGLSLSFGNAAQHESFAMGMAQEASRQKGEFSKDAKPITSSSLYDLASLTKLFTAVAVLQLNQRGKLRFDDLLGHIDKRFHALRDTTIFDVLSYQAV
ncbi:MAG: beta-lactamase family protein, partial [Clostridiales bacterium]|nr:beta-lactamase family protein [Clostridiales bacterium]